MKPWRCTAVVACVAIALVASPTVASAQRSAPLAAAAPAPTGQLGASGSTAKVAPGLTSERGRVAVFVELLGEAAADAFSAARSRGIETARAAARQATITADRTADAVVGAARGADPGVVELYRTNNAVAGVAIIVDGDQLAALARRADVVSILPIVPKRIENAEAARLTRVLDVWQSLGRTGAGMRVGIVDTGVDYTHANFGGAGTPAAFDAIDPTVTAGVFPTTKVVGGFDFAGETYDADSDDIAVSTPDPDPNPLDCDGHGSHVAGTAAGFGVNADGSTFAGSYAALTAPALHDMRIGPGMAPQALVYALKVFGCGPDGAGSTFLVGAALDWALDPNNDDNFTDRLDVVNTSIGADYSAPDDADELVAGRVMKQGVMLVFSAGNGGDLYDIGAGAPETLSVASTRDAYILRDAIAVTAPAGIVGTKPGQYSTNFDYAGLERTAPVVRLNPANAQDRDGCVASAYTAAVTGKIVWLEWDDNDATRRCGSGVRTNHASAAGAVGVLLTSTLEHFAAGIAGNAIIPVFQMTASATVQLRPALEAGTLVARMADDLAASLKTFSPDIEDTASPFTSRGTRTPVVKPDLAAPGDTIVSTLIGSGDGAFSISGTSMASPHAAGIATLLRQARPTWTTAEVKAALMNTANAEVFSQENQSGPVHAPNRVGSGRIDARAALTNLVVATAAADPALVSVSFGVVETPADLVRTKNITLTNKGATAATYGVTYQPITGMPGVSYSVSPGSVTIAGGATASVTVTLNVDYEGLRKVGDPTIQKVQLGVARQFLADASGPVVFAPTSGATVPLRVPVYAAPKPVADINVPAQVQLSGTPQEGLLPLSGRGLNQGSGDQRYLSLLSALELQAQSPQLPACTDTVAEFCALNETARGGDLRYVGAASTAPAAVAAGAPEQAMLGFGIATWANWANIGNNTVPFVDIDVNRDGDPDFETFVFRFDATDVLVAETVDLETGDVVDIQPVNVSFGDVDTNVFDSNVIVLPVSLEALGIDPEADTARLSYFIGVAGYYGTSDGLVDFVPDELSFDPLKPGLWVEGAGAPSLVHQAQPGTNLEVHRDPVALAADGATSLLVLNLHNATGDRASVVAVLAKASPAISTQASAGGLLGVPVRDVATLTGGASPTGTVTFRLFSNASCTTQVFTSTNPVSASNATSGWFTPAAVGTYFWTAAYSGDSNNNAATSPCGAPNESVTITPFTAPPPTQTITGDFLGPLTVNAGQSVVLSNARVVGPVTVNPGGALNVVGGQISRGVSANGPSFFSMCGAEISGPVPGVALAVSNAAVPIRVGDPATGCVGNRFAGQVNLTANRAVTFGANTVSHTATINGDGPGNTVVKANTVFGTLACATNNPAPTNAGQPNTAPTKTGQCASL